MLCHFSCRTLVQFPRNGEHAHSDKILIDYWVSGVFVLHRRIILNTACSNQHCDNVGYDILYYNVIMLCMLLS